MTNIEPTGMLTQQAASDSRHVQELTERAAALTGLSGMSDTPVAVVPAGHGIAVVDAEVTSTHPARPRGFAVFGKLEPLGRYVNAHRSDATTVWLEHDPDRLGKDAKPIGRIEAVLDDHHPSDEAGWGEHRATFPIITTPQWRHWLKADGVYLDQEDFSEHLRQGLSEIKDPDAATVLEVAENLTVTTNASLTSVVRTGGDLRVEHTKEQTARSGTGKTNTEIPEVFTLSIAPFPGAPPVELQARLKYKSAGGDLYLGYVLVRPLEVLRDAVDRLEHDLRGVLDGSLADRIYNGTPIDVQERHQQFPGVDITTVPAGD